MSSITTWIGFLAQILGLVFMIWWNVKKKEWAKQTTDAAKIKDQNETKHENQDAQQQLGDSESQNDADREKIREQLKG